jgi:glycosyltransferase involved in cell wall biosynthesis
VSPALAVSTPDASTPAAITQRYLLAQVPPFFRDEEGKFWLERLWHRDLVEHLVYLKRLVVVTHLLPKSEGADLDLVPVTLPGGEEFRLAALPPIRSTREALANLPTIARTYWKELEGVQVVHSSLIGWPFPLGWVVNPMALLRGRLLLINVESGDYRPGAAAGARAAIRARAWLIRHLGRFFARRADLRFFTHTGYRDALLDGDQRAAHVVPACWLSDQDVLSELEAQRSWAAKPRAPLRVLFAGRLIEPKGVRVLLEAARLLHTRGAAVRIDVMGEGPLRDEVRGAGGLVTPVDPVPYGAPFFERLRHYHLMVVPTLTAEQPRILYDAAAQAVPALASDTDGNRQVIAADAPDLLVPAGDPAALASRLASFPIDRARLAGLAALAAVRGHTIQAMHRRRWEIIAQALADRAETR